MQVQRDVGCSNDLTRCLPKPEFNVIRQQSKIQNVFQKLKIQTFIERIFPRNSGIPKSAAARLLTHGTKNCRVVKSGKSFWCTTKKHRGYKKITPAIKAAVNYCIIKYPHVIVSTITNDCVNINDMGSNKNKSITKILPKNQLQRFVTIWYGPCHRVDYQNHGKSTTIQLSVIQQCVTFFHLS